MIKWKGNIGSQYLGPLRCAVRLRQQHRRGLSQQYY